MVVTLGNGGVRGFSSLRRVLTGRHPNSGIGMAIIHSGGRGRFRVALGGRRNAAGMIGSTKVRVLNTTFGPMSSRLGGRLGLNCNLRIAKIAGNGVTSTNVHGNFVVLGTGKIPVGAMSSLRGTVGRTEGSPRRNLFVANVFPSKGHTVCTISLARRWGVKVIEWRSYGVDWR